MNDQFDLGFSFRGDQLSRSFSTSSDESLQGPATPPSGRSTPGLFEPTDQGNMAYGTLDMGATPPASTFGPFPTDVLKDGSHCLTLDPALYEPGIVTPQFDFPQQDYTLGDICNMSQWPWPPENESIMFLNGLQPKMPNQAFYLPHAYPFVQEQTIPLSLAQGRPQEQPPARVPARPQRQAQGRLQEQPPAQAPARPRRQAQGKVLHRVQDGGVKPRARPQANKRNNMPMVKIGKGLEKLEVGLCPRSGFECPGVEDPITKKIVDCFKRFQRKEHLKRHIKTVHLNQEKTECLCCVKCVNRIDNAPTHIITHMDRLKGKPRSDYYPEAYPCYMEMRESISKRKNSNPKLKPGDEWSIKKAKLDWEFLLAQHGGELDWKEHAKARRENLASGGKLPLPCCPHLPGVLTPANLRSA